MTTRPAAPERLTEAGAELAAYLWGVLIAVPDDRRPRINAEIRRLLETAEGEARADERARLRAAVEALPGEVGHFDGGDDFDTGYLTRAAVLALLADPPS